MSDDAALGRWALPLLAITAVTVLVAFGMAQGVWLSNLHNGLLAASFTAVGASVHGQRPRHREGWLLLATGVVEAVLFLGRQVEHAAPGAVSPWWGWLGVWPIALALTVTTFAVICFPDGRLPSPRWRPVAVAVVVVATVCAAMSALWPVEYRAAGVVTAHPFATEAPRAMAAVWAAAAHPAYVGFQVLWPVAVAARWRTARDHVRVQLAILAATALVSTVVLVAGLMIWRTPRPGLFAAPLVPIAAGWALIHGQQLAAYRALSWLSRRDGGPEDLPTDLAETVARALAASAATLWAGSDPVSPVGVWPAGTDRPAPASLDELERSAGLHVRPVVQDGHPIGALSVDRPRTDWLAPAEHRLFDALAAQAALVLAHLDLTGRAVNPGGGAGFDQLSRREREVLELLARGLSNAAICRELHLSIKTIEPAISSIFTKLGLPPDATTNRRVLAAVAYQRAPGPPTACNSIGFVVPSDPCRQPDSNDR